MKYQRQCGHRHEKTSTNRVCEVEKFDMWANKKHVEHSVALCSMGEESQ